MTRQQRPRGLLPSLLTASAVALLAPGLPSFVLGAGRPAERPRLRASLVAASEGSASSSPAIAAEDAKAQLMELLADATLAAEVLTPEGRPARGRVSEAILRLEALNPNSEPVYSEDLDGTWKVMYTGSFAPGLFPSPTRELAMFLYGGGYSLGNLLTSFAAGFWGQAVGVKQGPRSVRIQGGRDVDAKATIEVAGQTQTVSYAAELMPLSARRMSEEVLSVELPGPAGKQDLPFELRRTMLITYLDGEVMVVRDESGVPEVLTKELTEVVPLVPKLVPDALSDVTGDV